MNFGLQAVSFSPVDCGFIQTQAGSSQSLPCILINQFTPDIIIQRQKKSSLNADPPAFEEMLKEIKDFFVRLKKIIIK